MKKILKSSIAIALCLLITSPASAIDIKGSVSHVLPGTQITFSVR